MFRQLLRLFQPDRNYTYQLFDGRYIDLYKMVQLENMAELKTWAAILAMMLSLLISGFLLNA